MSFSKYYQNEVVAKSYDSKRNRGIKSPLVRLMERMAVMSLIPSGKIHILEAGVGTGYFTELLVSRGNLDGVDISKEMIAVLKKKINGVRLFQADILSLRLPKKYDCIVSVRVISHFDRDNANLAIKNLTKHLKDKGFMIFNLENPSILRRIMRKVTNWGSTYTYQYSKRDSLELIESSGLKKIKEIYIDHLFLYPLHVVNKLGCGFLNKTILKIERSLENVRFSSANVFLKCQK